MQTIIHTPTPKLESSLDFYSKLNFKVLSPENPTLVSDGSVVIEINPDRFARAGVKLLKPSWVEEVRVLEQVTRVLAIEGGYLLSDASGMWIYLIEAEPMVYQGLPSQSSGVVGNYVGVSVESIDMQKSCDIWQALGFSQTMGAPEQGWVVYANAEGMAISIMAPFNCPHLFFTPSLTYFNGKVNPAIIENIRSVGIPITEEITHFNKEGMVDNIIIRDPGGYGFFVFND